MINDLIYNYPIVLVGFVIVSLNVGLSMGIMRLAHRFIDAELRRAHTEVAGFVFGVLGVVYAVLLGFAAVAVWEDYDTAEAILEREADLVGSLFIDASGLSAPIAAQVRRDLRSYAEQVMHQEWEEMAAGRPPTAARETLEHLGITIQSSMPENVRESIYLTETLRRFNHLFDARHDRITAADNGVESAIWVNLVIGGIITIGCSFLFGVPNFSIHVTMTAMLAGMISLVMVQMIALDYPFRGDLRIEPKAFETVIGHMDHLTAERGGGVPGS